MQVRLLGTVDVTVDGTVRPVSGARRKALLALLALHAGEVVSTDRIADVLWGDSPPATAVNTVQSHVSHLRQVVGDRTALRSRPPGYLLAAGDEPTDVVAAERLVREGGRAGEPARRVELLQCAVDLWRGRPLADVQESPWSLEQVRRLDELLLQARTALVDARLALGAHAQLIPELERLTREQLLDERLHAQLMLALYRAGRQADALAVLSRLRRALDEELGLVPGAEVRELELAILRQDPVLDLAAPPVSATTRAPAPARAVVPAQLPLAVRGFAGRAVQVAALHQVLIEDAAAQHDGAGGVVVCAISGAPGTGKTSLAVHWAHQVADRYPDGQLYVNLRGFDPSATALDPSEALQGFLVAFGVPARDLPATLSAQAALYRSLLAGRRVLVVLDNARDAAHVRHLLPGAPGSLVLVTSRDQLTPLVATEAAHLLVLGPLAPDGARDLLARRLGADRVAAAHAALDEIVRVCGRLPLALAVVAARAAVRPDLPLHAVSAELAATTSTLDALTGGDAATDVRGVFDWSYRALDAPAARLFRLLGLHPGPDTTVAQAASLVGLRPEPTRELLAELTAANLLQEHAPGRHALHDLLRAYARERVEALEPEDDRRAALRRLLDHYLHSAHAAVLVLDPARRPLPLAPPGPDVTVAQHADHEHALAWFVAERSGLVAAVGASRAAGLDDHTWQLAWSLTTFFDWIGATSDLVATQELALEALGRTGDRSGQAHAHRDLGRTLSRTGDHDRAACHLDRALRLYGQLGDQAGQARAHHSIGWLLQAQGRPAEALVHAREELRLFRAAGDRVWEARALNAHGELHAQLGDYRQTLEDCGQALVVLQELGDRHGEAGVWDSTGMAHHRLGDLPRAVACYETARELYSRLGDRATEADVLLRLGDALLAGGDEQSAHGTWRRAQRLLEELDLPLDPALSRLDRADDRQVDRA